MSYSELLHNQNFESSSVLLQSLGSSHYATLLRASRLSTLISFLFNDRKFLRGGTNGSNFSILFFPLILYHFNITREQKENIPHSLYVMISPKNIFSSFQTDFPSPISYGRSI